MGVPPKWMVLMENPIKTDDLEISQFRKPPYGTFIPDIRDMHQLGPALRDGEGTV